MHGVDEAEALLHAAFARERGDGAGDVDKAPAVRHFKPELFGERFHAVGMPQPQPLRKRDRDVPTPRFH